MAKVMFDYILDDLRLKGLDEAWEEALSSPSDICYKDGNVGIGTEYPMYSLDVNGSIGVNNTIYGTISHLRLEAATGGYIEVKPRHSSWGIVLRSPTTNNYGNFRIKESVTGINKLELGYNTNSTMVGIDTSGYLYVRRIAVNQALQPSYGVFIGGSGNTGSGYAYSWVSTSDRRFKVEDRAYINGLSKIMALTPVSFNWLEVTNDENGNTVPGSKSKANRDIGFIAQDLHKVIPELSKKPEDETKTMWGIDYAKLTTVLVSAVQEQQAQINEMSKRILALEGILTR